MKRLVTLGFILCISASITFAQNAIFLHHSTGAGVWSEGNVENWIETYNTDHSTNYIVTERNYPDTPYPWENYPYDYWNLWVNNACDSEQPTIECINTLTQNYNVIIFKHCFPGAGIEEDLGTPDVTSDRKSLENYKLQYRALRSMMDRYPNNKFIVWTLAPLHRNATDKDQAARARQFVDWVKNTWLTEDGNPHSNIFIFDFYNIVGESDPTPANGQVNCLKYEYEGDHDGSDSHPNTVANQVAGPLFAQFIVDCFEKNQADRIDELVKSGIKVTHSKGNGIYFVHFDKESGATRVMVYSLSGELVWSQNGSATSCSIPKQKPGVYILKLLQGNQRFSEKLVY